MASARIAPPRPILTDVDLMAALWPHSKVTRSAILLTLTLDIEPEEVTYLTWSQMRNWPLCSEAIKLLNGLPRHLFSDLIFWEMIDGDVIPLLDLCRAVESVIRPHSLAQYRAIYKDMIYVNQSIRHFKQEMSENVFWRT